MKAVEHLARTLVRSALFVATGAPVVGWWLMLLMGILHHEIHPSIPTIGYWPSVFIMALAKPVLVYGTYPSKISKEVS